jgi:hypothetical protein
VPQIRVTHGSQRSGRRRRSTSLIRNERIERVHVSGAFRNRCRYSGSSVRPTACSRRPKRRGFRDSDSHMESEHQTGPTGNFVRKREAVLAFEFAGVKTGPVK